MSTLVEYLEAGDSIDLFLYDFPGVHRDQVIAFLEFAKTSKPRSSIRSSRSTASIC